MLQKISGELRNPIYELSQACEKAMFIFGVGT
jgi:hypothetical protein